MAKKDSADRRFTQDVHIRLTQAEADRLQKKADELGTTLSKAGRMLMFKRLEPVPSAGRNCRQELHQAVDGFKATFKKVNTDIAKILAAYERSLTIRNRSGEPAVSTGQTLRIMESVAYNQVRLQDGLNEIIRSLGGSEVHVAAAPRTAQEEAGGSTPQEGAGERDGNWIPNEFTHMANITAIATIVSEPETYMNGTYEMIRIVVQVEEPGKGGARNYYRIDCTDFKSRYAKILEHLVPGKKVAVSGDHRYTVESYNGRKSDSAATIKVSNVVFL